VLPQEGPALAPVRDQLLRRAREEAEAALDAARADRTAQIEAARTQARRLLDEARAAGEAQAAAESDRARSAARRRARALELAAASAVYDALREGVERGILALAHSAGYPRIRQALQSRAVELLGPGAESADDPRGGVVATVPGRRVDLSLPAIAARAIDGLDEKAARLWTR
jgi:vacuolar-type H+-ATPase subunit E/Vma4